MKNKKTIMFVSSILILIFHLWINIFDRTSNLYNVENFIRQICFIGVDIFFFISSYTIAIKDNSNYKEFIKSRFKRIYIPYIIFCLIALFYMNMNFKTFILNITGVNLFIRGGGSFLWFIPAIMIVYLLLPLYKKIENNKLKPVIIISLWLILSVIFSMNSLFSHIFIFTNRIPIILMGYYFGKLNIFEKLNKKNYILVTSLLIIFGILILYNFKNVNLFFITDVFYLYAIPLIVGVILLVDLIKTNKIINKLGSITLELYAMQMIFGYKITGLLLIKCPVLLTNILTIVIIIVLSIMIHYVFDKIIFKKRGIL